MRASRYKGIVGLILIFCLFVNSTVFAQVPAPTTVGFTGRLNVAINQLIGKRLAKYGFAANDPRFKATSDGVSGGLTVLGGVALAGGTAVSWPALLTAAGISGLLVGGVSLAQNSDYKWTWGSNGSVTVTGSVPGTAFVPPSINTGTPLVKDAESFPFSVNGGTAYASTAMGALGGMAAVGGVSMQPGTSYCQFTRSANDRDHYSCGYQVPPGGAGTGVVFKLYGQPAPGGSVSGYFWGDVPNSPGYTLAPVTHESVKVAEKAIPAVLRDSLITVDALAAVANTAWKAALPSVQSGGVPWPASDPITPAEVQEWMSTNPSSVPNVGDFASPANWSSGSGSIGLGGGGMPSGGGGGTPVPTNPTNPGTQPGTDPWIEPETPPVTPGQGTEINWGPNPNIGAPNLESTPTAKSILDPVFDLMPSLKSFTAPSHQSVCPTGSFSAFGKQYLISSHCNMFEENRSVIAGSMALVFAIASLVIVLRA